MFSRVDFPEPLAPTMATDSPSPIRRVTPRRALTATFPSPWVRPSPEVSMRPTMLFLVLVLASGEKLGKPVEEPRLFLLGADPHHQLVALAHAVEDLDPSSVAEAGRDRHGLGDGAQRALARASGRQ